MQHLLLSVASWIESLISSLGYWGIFIGMVIESASIPLPSEIIMGFAGYLVFKGEMTVLLAGLVGALGNITGSTIMYTLGIKGGRPLLDKYGRYIRIKKDEIEKSDKWFQKWGDETVFISQLLPGIRTFISFPAGILRINFVKFITYTFLGALIWCTALAFFAFKLGENWEKLSEVIHKVQYGLAGVVLVGVAWFLYTRINKRKARSN
ncbi:DedA family protein [Candidatus Dojkabacteria bacterium]|uniref:DedA family protein n=1 Tax=Candidatus Dojkabacteria bacterium TaxID=2099670 RepID=A0A955KWG1_9BACT|nr:DedA family protein [Candidatus Dojkabacteria bacterium]